MSETIELDSETHDRLLSYQRDDETLSETAARVLPAVLPHSARLSDAGIDAATFDDETRFVLERWPGRDGQVRTLAYESITQYIRDHKNIAHTALDPDDVATDGVDHDRLEGASEVPA